MSTFFTDINGALRTRLSTLSGAPEIAYENFDFKPDSRELFLRATHLPGDTVQACFGDLGKDEHVGVFQVDVFIPIGDGRSVWPDQIADHMKRGTVLTQNDVNVRITTVSIGPGLKDDHFYIVPVSINYQAFTAARS